MIEESIARRDLLLGLLAAGRGEEVASAVIQDPTLIPDVFRLLYHSDLVVRHRAAAVLGEAAHKHPARARPLLERLAWAMNDESGNHCPGAAAAIAEVAVAQPHEAAGFVPVLVAMCGDDALIEDPRQVETLAGVLWAAGHLARAFAPDVSEASPALFRLLAHPEPRIRGLAARALVRLGSSFPPETLKALLADTAEVEYVECGHLVRRTIRDLVLHETLAPCCGGGTCRPLG